MIWVEKSFGLLLEGESMPLETLYKDIFYRLGLGLAVLFDMEGLNWLWLIL